MEVGVKALRQDLSKYLKRVAEGEECVIPDRGMPVARLVSASGPSRYEALLASGAITPAKGPKTDPSTWGPRPTPRGGTVSDIVIEHRR